MCCSGEKPRCTTPKHFRFGQAVVYDACCRQAFLTNATAGAPDFTAQIAHLRSAHAERRVPAAIKEHANNLNQIIRARTENCDRRGVCGVSTEMPIGRDRIGDDGWNAGARRRTMVAAAARGCRRPFLKLSKQTGGRSDDRYSDSVAERVPGRLRRVPSFAFGGSRITFHDLDRLICRRRVRLQQR